MHDLPYLQQHQLGPEVTATMTAVCAAVRRVLPEHISCGVQVLAGGNQQALAVALASGFTFIRAEGFVFSHVADEGLMNACAGELLRYRRNIGATNIKIFADIKKKHCSHAVTSDVSLQDTAKAAEFFCADGLVVTGSSTGDPATPSHIEDVRKASGLPVLVGSGVTADNVHNYLSASGFIIGTHFKRDGRWENEVCQERVENFMAKLYNSTQRFE
ncbi:uncharacterized protein F13E9.13, mitochondrial isoform X2 [Macrosteles quadrilineatus]|nr:uncharacterized protein F13E9.13, mitochondrial isoform X2 [Macrosteles quadrilineatus]